MIRVASEDRQGAVDLFAEHDACEFVRQRHGAEGEALGGAFARILGPAVCRTDGEDDELPAFVALAAQPFREGLGGHLLAALVEQDEHRCGSTALVLGRLPESIFGSEDRCIGAGLAAPRFTTAGQQRRDAVEIAAGEDVEGIAGPSADGGNPELHGFSVGAASSWRSAVGEQRVPAVNGAEPRSRLSANAPDILIEASPVGAGSNLYGAMV
jgi:hypothetical protein